MESIECNIAKFNKHVRVLQGSIYQHDEECPNLLINLFTAYHTVQVIDFKDFVKLQLTLYFNGKADFEVEELMEVASNQYKMLVKSGTWKSTTATKDHFVALTAEIAALEQANANKRGEGGQADSHSKEGGQKVKGSNQKKRKNTHPPGSPQLQRRENRRKRLLG